MTQTTTDQTGLIGKAKEFKVAALLIECGLYVFFPLVDTGIDLVVTDSKSKAFAPLQVRYRKSAPGLGLSRRDVDRFKGRGLFLVYLLGEGEKERIWFIPFEEWRRHATDPQRRDGRIYVTVSKNEHWLARYEDVQGLEEVKKRLAGSSKKGREQ